MDATNVLFPYVVENGSRSFASMEWSWLKEGAFAYFGRSSRRRRRRRREWRHAAPPILVSQIETPKAKAPRSATSKQDRFYPRMKLGSYDEYSEETISTLRAELFKQSSSPHFFA